MAGSSTGTAAAYDEVVYPGNPIPETHPERLAAVVTMFGMRPAPASRCRVLELGCGIGGNLMAMAYQWPDSEFVGIDVSARSIEIGRGNLAELGLRNAFLHHADIMEIGESFGLFDYIVAHGVYSWVPPQVRERLLAVFRAHLAPQGVAYVSYNAYPGAHLRDIARDIMLFHARGLDDPRSRIEQSRAMLKFVAETVPETSLHGRILRDQLKRIERAAEEVVFHDDLDPSATPFMLHEVAEAAARHGLQYLSDVNFGNGLTFDLPEPARKLIDQIPVDRPVEREQYIDFVEGRAFRRTLLCRDDIVLDRPIGAERIRDFFFAGRLAPADHGADPLAPGRTVFRAVNRGTLETDHPLAKAALLHLGAIWPASVSFAALMDEAAELLRHAGQPPDVRSQQAVATAAEVLFRACAGRQVDMHSEPLRLTATVSERPQASLLARRQIEAGPVLTNLRHQRVVLEDPVARRFLTLVDGTRNVDELADELNAALAADASQDAGGTLRVTREQVADNLRILARLALLVG